MHTLPTVAQQPADPALADLLRRLPPDAADAVDLDEIVVALEALGIGDRTAQQRYAASSVFVLAERVLAELRAGGGPPWAGEASADAGPRQGYPVTAARRCGLYLTVGLAAVAGNDTLWRAGWSVCAAALVLGWGAAQALGYVARRVAGDGGPGPATRVVGGGFLVLAVLWCAAVATGPAVFAGTDRWAGYAVGCTAMALFATLAAALATDAIGTALRYSLPIWVLAAAVSGGAWDRFGPPALTPEPVLAALAAVAAVRVLLPGLRRGAGPTGIGLTSGAPAVAGLLADDRATTGPEGTLPAGTGLLRPAAARLLLGAAQAVAVLLVWRAGPAGTPAPGVVPALAAVPLLELFVGWHVWQVAAGLDRYHSVPDYARHLRGVATVTVAALVPPLAVGLALVAAARRLPYGLADHAQAQALVLALAAGVMLAGLLAATRLLAAHDRPARAAAVAALPAILVAASAYGWGGRLPQGVLRTLTGVPDGPLPGTVAALAVAHLVGLVAVAGTVFDRRSRR